MIPVYSKICNLCLKLKFDIWKTFLSFCDACIGFCQI